MSELLRPAYSQEAEESVIGGVLVHPRKFLEAAAALSADDFYHPAHRAIYEAMSELDSASKPIDAVTIVEQMRSMGTFEKLHAFNGADFLTELMSKVVTTENIGYHAGIVRSKADRRQWQDTLRGLMAASYSDESDVAFKQRAEQELLALALKATQEADSAPIKTYLKQFADDLAERVKGRKEGRSALVGVTTGYEHLDRMTSGLRDSELTIIAARPSMGKTAYAMNIVERAARAGVAWMVFSLEMPGKSLTHRMVSGAAGVDGHRLSQGDVEIRQWGKITTATSQLAVLPIEICERTDLTIARIRSLARRHRLGPAAKFGKFGVMVDYLQLIETPQRRGQQQNRERDVSEISRGLKQLARDLRCPVIALSQLNRNLEARSDKRPMMSDLRESGSIEQDADVITFLYRDEVYSGDECKDEDKGMAEVIIGKQRNGSLGTVRLAFNGAFTRFDDAREEYPTSGRHWQDKE